MMGADTQEDLDLLCREIASRQRYFRGPQRMAEVLSGLLARRGYAQVTAILADALPYGGMLQFETAAALIELGRTREAVRYSRRAVELEPRVVNHWLVHAHGLLLSGHEDEGRVALKRVLELEPGNPTALTVLEELDGK